MNCKLAKLISRDEYTAKRTVAKEEVAECQRRSDSLLFEECLVYHNHETTQRTYRDRANPTHQPCLQMEAKYMKPLEIEERKYR
jgi:hypothetical protein